MQRRHSFGSAGWAALCAVAWLLLAACQPAATPVPALSPQSGYDFQSAETQALQDDDFANPGMLWVDQGAALWTAKADPSRPACAGCHEVDAMIGVATRYPAYAADAGRLLNLEARINRCREQHQQQPAWPYDSEPLLAMTAYVAHQSRGLPIAVKITGDAQPFYAAGKDYFYTRRGQMNLACHHCHEQHVGNMLRGDRLSQGQPNGYPIYRLAWQGLGSLHRRLQFCNVGVRAQSHAPGSPTYVNLELYLAWRATGLPVESPAVRR